MDAQFPSGVVYAPSLPPNRQLSTTTSPYQLPQPSSTNTQTLPSLQSHTYSQGFSNDPFGQRLQASQPSFVSANTPTISHATTFPVYATSLDAPYPGHQSSYAQPARPFQPPHTYSSQPSTTQAFQTYAAPVPMQVRRPELRPMPAGGLTELPQISSYSKGSSASSLVSLQSTRDPQPTHVVGSQGRRGILPSTDGRPPAVGNGTSTSQKSAGIPPKDAEGKYPCPYCTKNYLHAKHLKRHLLRHTGVRPYSCGLCKDTFSRSDILKRHFQKCSVRRGNPSGASHLAHSRANRKANVETVDDMILPSPSSAMPPGQVSHLSGFPSTNLQGSLNIGSLRLGQTSYAEEQHGLPTTMSQSNGVKHTMNSLSTANRGPSGPSKPTGFDHTGFQNPTGHITPDSVTTSGAATPYPYPQDSRPNQFSDGSFSHAPNSTQLDLSGTNRAPAGSNYSSESLPQIVESSQGHRSDLDWLFPPGSQGDFSIHSFQSGIDHSQQPIKPDPNFSKVPFSLAPDYAPFLPTKV